MREKPRILLIDDERPHVQAMSIRLRAAGFEILAAHDGRAGLEVATTELPDAIVMDIQMPELDGLALLAELARRDSTRSIPVVMVSACADREQEALDAGARFFLAKPYENKRLLAALESVTTNTASTPSP
ncbi:MAG: response regulator [Pirellulales bacterium]|nr:response regulator [Pirellulales bacterium]